MRIRLSLKYIIHLSFYSATATLTRSMRKFQREMTDFYVQCFFKPTFIVCWLLSAQCFGSLDLAECNQTFLVCCTVRVFTVSQSFVLLFTQTKLTKLIYITEGYETSSNFILSEYLDSTCLCHLCPFFLTLYFLLF